MNTHIQFACTANQGRSPVAEAVANHHLAQLFKKGALDLEVRVSSSGTRAEEISSGQYDLKGQLYVLTKGVGFDETAKGSVETGTADPLYHTEEIRFIQRIFAEGVIEDSHKLDVLVARTSKQMETFEHQQRNKYLQNTPYVLKNKAEQTIANPSITKLVGMTESNSEAARKIWKEAKLDPKGIVTDAGVYLGRTIDNVWGSPLPSAFERMYAQIEADIPRIVDIYLHEPKE